jgi:hypothetical protein
MRQTRLKDWAFFVMIALIAGFASRAFLIHADTVVPSRDETIGRAADIKSPIGDRQSQETAKKSDSARYAYNNFYALRVGEKVMVGKLILVYRGFDEEGRFKLDVAVPELDADAYYPYHFRRKDSAKTIKLNNYAFRVLSARRTVLHLQAADK